MTSLMPTTQYSLRLARLFGRFVAYYLRRHFNAVRVSRSGPAPNLAGPTILYSNHASWWDPMIGLFVGQRLFPEWRLFAPMNGRALERYSILKRLGLFPLAADSYQSIRELMRCTDDVLREPMNLLAITAHGNFVDVRDRPTRLRRGITGVLGTDSARRAIPVAIEYTFWNERLPEALIRFGEPVKASASRRCAASRTRLHEQLERGLEQNQDALALESRSRDPTRFETLILGHSGSPAIYDLYERVRCRLQGRRFGRSHADVNG